jgi:hypothetical protein
VAAVAEDTLPAGCFEAAWEAFHDHRADGSRPTAREGLLSALLEAAPRIRAQERERSMADAIDVYPVGLFRDLRQFRYRGQQRRVRRLVSALRYPYRQARKGDWRAVENYFNGYLAEPYEFPPGVTRCGSGWTRRRALLDLRAQLASADQQQEG